MEHNLKTLHLFAGAGGGILADILLRHKPVGAVEIEEYPRKTLLQRQLDGVLPEFPVWDDVTTFRRDNPGTSRYIEYLQSIRSELCIAGGFPCQDISSAGRGAGIEGNKSGLWVEMARIIREIRPAIVFVENSPMLTIRGLYRVLGDLSTMGYNARWGVVGAHHIGAPHRRNRIFILANSNSERESQPKRNESDKRRRFINRCKEISHASSQRQSGQGTHWYAFDPAENGEGEAVGAWAERFGRIWGIESPLGRVAHGVANRVDRLTALGNGQVPSVAATAFRLLK